MPGVMSEPTNKNVRPGDADSPALSSTLAWLREVDGRLMHKRDDPHAPDGWVAIVRTPAPTGRKAQLILGFGDSAIEAVSTARDSWQEAWREISATH